MITANNLQFIGQLMSADFIDLEQVDFISLLAHIEIPDSEELAPQTVHWLICFHGCMVSEEEHDGYC